MFLTAPNSVQPTLSVYYYRSEQWIWTWNRTWPYPLRIFFFDWATASSGNEEIQLFRLHYDVLPIGVHEHRKIVRETRSAHLLTRQCPQSKRVMPDRFLGAEGSDSTPIQTNFKACCFRNNNIGLKKYFSVRSNIKPHAACIYGSNEHRQTWYLWKHRRKKCMRFISHMNTHDFSQLLSHSLWNVFRPVFLLRHTIRYGCFLTGRESSSDSCRRRLK